MKEQLKAITDDALSRLNKVQDIKELEEIRVSFLGKKGRLTGILKGMGSLSPEERPVIGQMANEVRNILEEAIQKAKKELQKRREKKKY